MHCHVTVVKQIEFIAGKGKKGWRIITRPASPLSRVGRYKAGSGWSIYNVVTWC